MKKKAKILSIALSLLMSIGLVTTTFTTTFAEETITQSTTPDNAYHENSFDDEYEHEVKNIEVTKRPDKTEYTLGKDTELNFQGLELTVTFGNGTTKIYTYTDEGWADSNGYLYYDIEISPWYIGNLVVGDNTITVEYKGFTDEFTVTADETTVTGIELTKLPDKTEYTLGKDYELDFNELELTVTYANQTTKIYTCVKDDYNGYNWVDDEGNMCYDINCNIVDIDDLVVGDNTVTVEHMGFTDEFKITACEVTVTKIELTRLPDKIFEAPVEDYMYVPIKLPNTNEYKVKPGYYENAICNNMDGAELTVYYSNGETEILDFSNCIGNDKGRTFLMKYWSKGYTICVYEYGNYQAEVRLNNDFGDISTKFIAKNLNAPVNPNPTPVNPNPAPVNPNPAPVNPNPTPNNPNQTLTNPNQTSTSSEAIPSEATPSEVGSNTIKTGNSAHSILMLSILLISAGIFLFFNRTRYFNK